MVRMARFVAAFIAMNSAWSAAFPVDWASRSAAGQLLATLDLPLSQGGLLDDGYYPVVGNGFLGREMSDSIQSYKNTWPWRDSGMLHVNGFNNGLNFQAPSHRVQIPSLSFSVSPQAGEAFAVVGSAIDWGFAAFFNRTGVNSSACSNTVLEKRAYAHRLRRHVFVVDLTANPANASEPWTGCTLTLQTNTSALSADLTLTTTPCGNGMPCTVWSGTNVDAEETDLPLTAMGMVWDSWAASSPLSVSFTTPGETFSLRSVIYVDVDDDVPAGSSPAATAEAEWLDLFPLPATDLWSEHVGAWDALWARGGVELEGNITLAATVNASMYDILSSLRSDWLWSTGPGGLGTNGYCGHSFWDMETWMFPILLALHPDIAWAVSQYRLRRLGASMQRAQANNFTGAFWAWESGITGLDTAPWRQADLNEHHISADIPLAWRRFYYASGNKTFLQEAWPALNQTCTFWACRFTRTDSTGAPVPAGTACGAKDGVGNWTVHGVICPDESSGIVNDSVYTNAAGAETLSFCVAAAAILGESTPPLWAQISAAPYLPLVTDLSPDGPVHAEYTGYKNGTINQADVALLQYPLGLSFDVALSLRDLNWWSTKTDFAGMFTGDAAYSAAYLALGDRAAADEQIGLVWSHLEPHFNVFKETADGSGTQHFITGNGGYLQSFVFGYPGLRIERLGVFAFTSQQPVLPPLGITGVRLRGMSLFGVEFDFWYGSTTICAQLNSAGGVPPPPGITLELRTPGSGSPQTLVADVPVCVPVSPVEVAVVGMT